MFKQSLFILFMFAGGLTHADSWVQVEPEEMYCRQADAFSPAVDLYKNYFKPHLRQLLFTYPMRSFMPWDIILKCDTDRTKAAAQNLNIFVNIHTGERIIDDGKFYSSDGGMTWAR